MMIFKVITVISLLKVCAGDGPSQPSPQSNQAISSQSFVRHDVPLSYKYSWVHVYTTPKPDLNRHKPLIPQQHMVREQSPQIQYAPIYSEPSIQHPNANTIPESANLEPKPSEHMPHRENHPEHLSYVPGYNVEVFQAVNRIPGRNAVYRSYPNMPSNERLNKINFLNQYVLQDKEYLTTTQAPQRDEITTITTQILERPKFTLSAFVPKQHNFQKPQPLETIQNLPNVQVLPVQQAFVNLQEYLPHPKAHRMLLNIARTYNIAQGSLKAHNAGIMKNMPSHTQAFIQIRNPSEADKNNLLSIQNRNLYSPVHRSS